MHTVTFIVGVMLILLTLVDGFEGILLPRRVNHPFRYARLYFRFSWRGWRWAGLRLFKGRWREAMLGVYGPLSLLGLFGSWVACLIIGFGLVQWSLNALVSTAQPALLDRHFVDYLYFSGTTYFTLGLGDVVPLAKCARAFTILEAGLGFGFFAIIISYLPVLYQAFSRREVTISLLDARAGSPPTAGEFVRRLRHPGQIKVDAATLQQWEQWCAEVLESQVSFPVLGYYRSQHSNQSWVAALTMMLDACAVLIVLLPKDESHQAQLTFAMARHAAVDMALILGIRPSSTPRDRLAGIDDKRINELLCEVSGQEIGAGECASRLSVLRGTYEPFMEGIANYFVLALPPIIAMEQSADNWQRSAWMPRTPGIGNLPAGKSEGDHFG
jgi:hypothetical protein